MDEVAIERPIGISSRIEFSTFLIDSFESRDRE